MQPPSQELIIAAATDANVGASCGFTPVQGLLNGGAVFTSSSPSRETALPVNAKGMN
jgi:hypothetical protein